MWHHHNSEQEFREKLLEILQETKMAQDALVKAVSDLTASVEALIAKPSTNADQPLIDTEVQAINALKAKVDAANTPVPPVA
jgi:hypothetical protein